MTTKDWLNRGWKLNDEINSLLLEQQEALEAACSTTTTLQQDKVQTSRTNSTEYKMIKYADYSEIINQKTDELYDIKREIISVIRKLDDNTYKILLYERYIKFNCWDKIAKRINRNQFTTRGKIHGRALKDISQYIV